MNDLRCSGGERGTVLVPVVILMVVGAALILVDATLLRDQWADARFKQNSQQALYNAYGDLALAQMQIANSGYDSGRNLVLRDALTSGFVDGTGVEVTELIPDGFWFLLTARETFDGGERVVEQLVREIDSFASYNLFVAEHPVGISGEPVGAIHTNRDLQFYFPDGIYRDTITAVEGHNFKSGATDANTSILGLFDSNFHTVDMDENGAATNNLSLLKASAEADYSFPSDVEVGLRLYRNADEQWIEVSTYSPPTVETVDQITEKSVEVGGHWETYYVDVPVYTDSTKIVPEPVYKWVDDVKTEPVYGMVEKTKQVPVYDWVPTDVKQPIYEDQPKVVTVDVFENQTKTKKVIKDVFIPVSGGGGGSAVGGESGSLGFWTKQEVTETYTVKVKTGTTTKTVMQKVKVGEETVTVDKWKQVGKKNETYFKKEVVDTKLVPYKKKVVDYYEDKVVPIKVLSHYEKEEKKKWVKDYETQEFVVPVQKKTPRQLLEKKDLIAPSNGIIFAEGKIAELNGEVIGRLTIASEQSVKITDDLQYVDGSGDTMFVNGKDPAQPYEPNPTYDNNAVLGIVSRGDVIYGREVPFNFELNAAILSVEGRVGVEGIILDADGEVIDWNVMVDDWGDPVTGEEFLKNSIRRLGSTTTAQRPLDTVVSGGAMRAGFGVGTAVYDQTLRSSPPPLFLTLQVPRFFEINIAN